MVPQHPRSTLFPYTTLFRSKRLPRAAAHRLDDGRPEGEVRDEMPVHHVRSEEHTSELQSRRDLVCRLLLEKKNHTSYASAFAHAMNIQVEAVAQVHTCVSAA